MLSTGSDKFEEITKEEIQNSPNEIYAQGLNFAELVQTEQFNFRHTRKLRHQVEDALANGLGHGLNQNEAIFVRQHAYCLIFGIKANDIKTVERKKYEDLLN